MCHFKCFLAHQNESLENTAFSYCTFLKLKKRVIITESTVDPWATWGLGALTIHTVKRLCLTYSQPFTFRDSPSCGPHGTEVFTAEKILHVSAPMQRKLQVGQWYRIHLPMRETRVQSLGLGRSPGGGNGNLLQRSCLGNPMERGSWRASVHRERKESDTTGWLSILFSGNSSDVCSSKISGTYGPVEVFNTLRPFLNKTRNISRS